MKKKAKLLENLMMVLENDAGKNETEVTSSISDHFKTQ